MNKIPTINMLCSANFSIIQKYGLEGQGQLQGQDQPYLEDFVPKVVVPV